MPEPPDSPSSSPARLPPRASNGLPRRTPEDTDRQLPLTSPAPQLFVTTFPNFESAHDAIVLLNSAGIPPRIEVSAEIYGPIRETPPHARRVAITVPAGRVHEARMAIVGLRAAFK